jgi:hypothetical protein
MRTLPLWFVLSACNGPEATDTGDTDPALDTDPAAPDPLSYASEVRQDEIEATIAALEGLGTRYTHSDGDEAARDWLVAWFDAHGYAAETREFDAEGEAAFNVVVTKAGAVDPDVIYVFQAHYDSTSNQPATLAPGADDNASGVAAVLEAARILADEELGYTLMFVLTAAEEQGSVGSLALVEELDAQGADVRGVIAPDMIGYWPLGDGDAFDILGDDQSEHLVMEMADVADALGVANKVWIEHGYCYGDDHTNWQEMGFPAISPMDCVEAHNVFASDEETPHYHRTTDTLDTLHLGFTTKVTQVLVATFATWGEPQ